MTGSEKYPQYRFAIRRPVAVLMLFLTIIVFGWKSYQQLSVTLMPNISYPTLTVRTEYEGAAPEDVEKLVTRPLEEVLGIVSGLVEISSVSSPGLSEIVLEFTWGTDMNLALQEVRDRLDLFDPPKEVTEKPIILRYDPSLDPVLRVAITGSDFSDVADEAKRKDLQKKELTAIREACERHVKGDLEAENGIAQVLIKGGREQEVQIRVDADRLKNLGLSLQDLASSLAQQNINLSGGSLREGKTEYLVRTLNEFQDIEQIRNSVVTLPAGRDALASATSNLGSLTGVTAGLDMAAGTAGSATTSSSSNAPVQLRLVDVADVYMGEKERESVVHINGKEAVALDIFKDGDANTVQVCNELRDVLGFKREMTFSERLAEKMAEIQSARNGQGSTLERSGTIGQLRKTIRSRLPKNAEFTLISDQSRFIKGSIKEAQDSAVQGGFWALLVIFLFLQRWTATAIIGLAIPISLIATFAPMYMFGITLNVMSLGGLALAVGHLVDDSIIVLESIHRCREEGDAGNDAVERGVREIFGADISTTFTNIVVFLPIAFVGGIAGQIFGHFGFTMTFSLIASLITALYLDTMLTSLHIRSFTNARDVVWAVGAYHIARQQEGRGRIAALVSIPAHGFKFAAVWLKAMTLDTFGPIGRSLRAAVQEPGFLHILSALGSVVFSPLLALLFVLQVILKLITTILVTAVFVFALALATVVKASVFVINGALWFPLRVFDFVFNTIRHAYREVLRVSLQFGPVVLVIAALLAVHSGYQVKSLGRELIPSLKQGEFGIRMEAPPGTRLEETENRARKIEKILAEDADVASVGVEVGIEKTSTTKTERGENIAQFSVVLKDPEKNTQFQEAIMGRLRDRIAQVSPEELTFTLPTLFSFKTAVEVQIRGDDYEELKRIGRAALDSLEGIDGLKDAELSVKKGYPEIIVELDRDLLATKNLSPIQVAQRLRTEVQGDVATRFSQSGEKIDMRVRSDMSRLQSVTDLRRVSIVDGDPPVPLSAVAKISVEDGPSEMRRIDQRPVVLIRGNVEGFDLGSVTREIERRLQKVDKPKDYSFVLGGQNRELRTSFGNLQFALLLSMFLVYAVMACQFESLIQPALIMFTIPLGFIGVINALKWTSIPLSIAVFMGGILLVGIVVNNSMLLVDYANQLRERGRTKRQAIFESGQVRLRPVLMTAITTIVGAVPMAINAGEGSELRRPLAVTVIAGLTVATVLTLVVIPVVYDLFSRGDKKVKKEEE